MPRRKSAAYMSAGEQIAGTVLFVIYLLVLPFVTTPLFRLIGGLLGVTISTGLQNILYYYILFAATVIISTAFWVGPPGTLQRTWAWPASSWPSDWWPCTA